MRKVTAVAAVWVPTTMIGHPTISLQNDITKTLVYGYWMSGVAALRDSPEPHSQSLLLSHDVPSISLSPLIYSTITVEYGCRLVI